MPGASKAPQDKRNLTIALSMLGNKVNFPVFDCRNSWATPIVREITFDWRDFVPLAKAEASKFYWRQERGRFRFEDLLSTALDALATSKGVNHAIKCINGALRDHARDGDKLVRDVEMTEEEWQRTRGGPPEPAPPADAPLRGYVENDLKITVWPMGLRRLKPRDGVATSKHDKVPVAIGRTTFNDGWSQQDHGRVRAKLDRDFQDVDEDGPPEEVKLKVQRGGNDGYTGAGTAKRWSKSCLSSGDNRGRDGVVHKSGLTPEGWQGFKLLKRNGKWSSSFQPTSNAPCRRIAEPRPDCRAHGRRTSSVKVDLSKFGLAPQNQPAMPTEARAIAALWTEAHAEDDKQASPAAAKLALSMEAPKSGTILWHRDAGYLQFDRDADPECWWGLPDHGVFIRDADTPDFGPKKHPWRRGKNIFSAACIKFPVWGDVIIEGGCPSHSPSGSAAGSGSLAGRAALPFAPADERLAGGTIKSAPSAEGADSPFYSEPILEDAPHLLTCSPWPEGGRSP